MESVNKLLATLCISFFFTLSLSGINPVLGSVSQPSGQSVRNFHSVEVKQQLHHSV